jgi:hypothetical protein
MSDKTPDDRTEEVPSRQSVAPLTPAQQEAIQAAFEQHGAARLVNFPGKFQEADFICGALLAFFATGTQDQIPAGWVFGPLAGRSLFEKTPGYKQHVKAERVRDAAPRLLATLKYVLGSVQDPSLELGNLLEEIQEVIDLAEGRNEAR